MCYLLCLAAVLVSLTSAASPGCVPPWKKNGTSCYWFVTGAREDWMEADQFCRQQNAKLVEIESATENEFLRSTLMSINTTELAVKDRNLWIGGTDLFMEGEWVWISNLHKMDSGFTDWAPKEPNEYKFHEDCAVIFHYPGNRTNAQNYHWIDIPCESKIAFVCEKGVGPVDTTLITSNT